MRAIIICLFTLAFSSFTSVGAAEAASITGSWKGSGSVRLTNGRVERIRCGIKYEEGAGGKTVVLYVTCAHANGTFKVSGRIVKRSGSYYAGRLYSEQYGTAGDVGVTVNGNSQKVTAKSSKGTASLVLTKR